MRTRAVITGFLIAAATLSLAMPGVSQSRAPRDPQVIDAQGYQKVVQQYHGKPLVMTFWATWCEPCRDEYPMLNELAKEYGPKGLRVVGINFNDDGDLILMRRFIARYKPVFPNFRKHQGDEAAFERAVSPEWNGALPVSFFYDKDGKLVGHVFGASNRETYEAAFRQLVAGVGLSAAR
ncbi:MAG TPA: TlpA disulfide reductase family protein [Candidatus Acidoferrum sp.]|nr:TlpA disulfide reductase family protein [Candidatus Acidoferrum sp.]